jgi:enoyl-CoA hydratase
LNRTTLEELAEAFRSISCDDTVRAVILTGAGDKAFVAGADIQELSTLSAEQGEKYARFGQQVFDAIEGSPKPVIAAVQGFALGGGCELAMACSIRIASDRAVFGQPEVRLGLIPGFGGSQRLPRLIGKGRALELLLTGESIDAVEAYRIGLVNKVVAPPELMPVSESFARTVAAHGAGAIERCLGAVGRGLDDSLAQGQAIEARLFGECCGTEDMRARTRAFLDRSERRS